MFRRLLTACGLHDAVAGSCNVVGKPDSHSNDDAKYNDNNTSNDCNVHGCVCGMCFIHCTQLHNSHKSRLSHLKVIKFIKPEAFVACK